MKVKKKVSFRPVFVWLLLDIVFITLIQQWFLFRDEKLGGWTLLGVYWHSVHRLSSILVQQLYICLVPRYCASVNVLTDTLLPGSYVLFVQK